MYSKLIAEQFGTGHFSSIKKNTKKTLNEK